MMMMNSNNNNKRAKLSIDKAVVNVWQRELGQLSTRNFAHRLGASEDLIQRLEIYKKLDEHRGCVNTVSFNLGGDILVSGSDDRRVILWDWETGNIKLSFHSGHNNNIFQAKIMPYTDDRSIVTCAADGQEFIFVSRNGGTDEYARLYDIRKYKWDGSTDFGQPADYFCPPHLIDDGSVRITGVAFSDQSELLISYNDEFIYLFSRDMGLGPDPFPSSPVSACSDAGEMGSGHLSAASPEMGANEKIAPQDYKGHRNCETVKGVSFFGPRCEYVISGSDCGRIFIWKKKGGELIRVMEADRQVVNCIESHPHNTVLASSGIEKDIKIWTPKAIERATLPANIEKVTIPHQMHCFAIGDYDDDEDDDDDDFYEDDVYCDDEDDEEDEDNDDGTDDDSDDDDNEYDLDDDDDSNNENDNGDDDGNDDNFVGANDADNGFALSLSS